MERVLHSNRMQSLCWSFFIEKKKATCNKKATMKDLIAAHITMATHSLVLSKINWQKPWVMFFGRFAEFISKIYRRLNSCALLSIFFIHTRTQP